MQKEWLHYNLYVEDIEMLDAVVDMVVRPACEGLQRSIQIHRWFFIRYLEFSGAHVRLRFLIKLTDLESAMMMLEQLFADLMPQVKSMNIQPGKRLIPIQVSPSLQGNKETRFELSVYEPELEKYGGKEGLAYSEGLFQLSSEISLHVTHAMLRGEMNRYYYGLKLLDRVLHRVHADRAGRVSFLGYYLNYWTGSEHSSYSREYRDKLASSARKRSAIVADILKDQRLEYMLDEYADYTYYVLEQLRQLKLSQGSDHFLFHYTHMMNNRLGIWPIEEAYLSALLMASYEELDEVRYVEGGAV